ncbi:hypothetical protein TSUD_298460 [Trifolium subterraneum]|nr:hypothetical protein TSUD_298460 [Trifolium subterraneum]
MILLPALPELPVNLKPKVDQPSPDKLFSCYTFSIFAPDTPSPDLLFSRMDISSSTIGRIKVWNKNWEWTDGFGTTGFGASSADEIENGERVVPGILIKWSAFVDMYNFVELKRELEDFDNLLMFKVTSCAMKLVLLTCFLMNFFPTFDNYIQGQNDACIKEDAKGLNAYHSSRESNKAAEGDVGAGSSSQFVDGELRFSNKVVNQVISGSPDLQSSCFQRQRRTTKNGMSTYVEKFVYARRKSCVKRKLWFDDKDDDVVIKSKVVKISSFFNPLCWTYSSVSVIVLY